MNNVQDNTYLCYNNLKNDKESGNVMKSNPIRPRDTRLISALLGFTGGAIDVFCHLQYKTLVATQTGNIVLLISDFRDSHLSSSVLRILSILFFSIGFLVANSLKDRIYSSYWEIHNLIPLFFVTCLIPFLPPTPLLIVPLLSFCTGLLMFTFSDTKIENYPYTIMMTSGNYRKMLTSWYQFIKGESHFFRQAINYTIIVTSFIIGAILSALLEKYIQAVAIWLVSLVLGIIILSLYKSEKEKCF